MAKDLRTWLNDLEAKAPEEMARIQRPIRPDRFEATALLEQMEERGRFEAVLFENNLNLRGEPGGFRLLMNTFATPRKVGVALGLPPVPRVDLLGHLVERLGKEVPPAVIPPGKAPVRERVWKGDELDLRKLPIVRHTDLDGGPYFTPIVAARGPGRGRHNISWNRMMYLDENHLALYMSPRHLWSYVAAAEKEGRNLPLAVILGHHPAFHLSAGALCPLERDEYALAGGFLGEALRLVPSEIYGEELLVPADAEAVIEGEVVAHRRTVEGPFGEFTLYCGPQRLSWLFEAKAVTFRERAVLLDIFTCHPDHINAHLPIEASLYARVQEMVPTVRNICWLESGGPFNLVISLKKGVEGEPMRAAMAAISAGNLVKNVIIVDEDIDPADPKEVMWAVSTRMQADRGVQILNGIQCSVLDPSLREEIKGAGLIIDATKPLDRPFPRRGRVPEEIRQTIPLDQFLGKGEEPWRSSP